MATWDRGAETGTEWTDSTRYLVKDRVLTHEDEEDEAAPQQVEAADDPEDELGGVVAEFLGVSVVRVEEIVDTLEDPGDAHHDEEFTVEDQLLLHVTVDPVRVGGVVRGHHLLSSVPGVSSFLGCQIGSRNKFCRVYMRRELFQVFLR